MIYVSIIAALCWIVIVTLPTKSLVRRTERRVYNFRACTSLLMSLYVVNIAGLSVSFSMVHSLNAIPQSV